MCAVRQKRIVAVVCSDLHLSLKPPLARAGEENWLEAQARPLKQIQQLALAQGGVPILCAGDIFDRWNSPPELINFAISYLPKMYAVPGQHDLPLHNLEGLHKSAYWTLVEAEVIHNLGPGDVAEPLPDFHVAGYPWGSPLGPPWQDQEGDLKVALVHQYVWTKGHSYPGAPKPNEIAKMESIDGWDAIVIGDNHKGFQATRGTTNIINCGTLMRRKSDEIDYKPQVGLLYDDGTIEPHYLDTSADIIVETESPRTPEEDMDLREFLEGLTKLGDSSLNFKDKMLAVLEDRKPSKAVRELILEAMEE